MLAGLVSLTLCKKEEQASTIQFTATMEECADIHNPKTALNGTVLEWVAGDEIKIYSGSVAVFTATPLTPATQATFTTDDESFQDAGSYIAYYPAANNSAYNSLTLPATQVSEDGSLRGFPMHAYSRESTNLQFRNLCGVLKLNLQKTGVTVTSIALTMDDPINGVYTVTGPATNQAELNSSPSSEGSNTTTLVCNQSINTAHDFYIYLPAGTYSGLTLTITALDGTVCTKGPATSSVVIERSKYSTLTLAGDDLVFQPQGAKDGLFTINEDGDQVRFSQGNLQYQASTNTWRFAEHQYDYVGSGNSSISTTYDGWIDLFGWGTGSNPTLASTTNTDYSNTFTDWGDNAISNGGNTANSRWRTLTLDEWNYLFNTRTNTTNLSTSDARYAKGTVNGVHGVILFPDGYTHPSDVTAPTGINLADNTGWNGNRYSLAQWTAMESAGAVFLPAAGLRQGTTVSSEGDYGFYWSSTFYQGQYSSGAHAVYFYGMQFGTNYYTRARGYSVRLVWGVH